VCRHDGDIGVITGAELDVAIASLSIGGHRDG
jgi:hypothetical protein